MFDIGAIELLLVAAVALIIIGPKDLPVAMRTAGRWMGQLRAMTGHFRVGIDAMIREAEVEEQEKAWAEKNAQIMREHPPEKFQDPELEGEAEPDAKPEAKDAKPDAPIADPDDDQPAAAAPAEAPDEPAAEAPDEPAAEPAPTEEQLPLLPDGPERGPGATKP